MRALLDTHVFLWWLADDPQLGPRTRALLADATNVVHVSAASVWETSIKVALGRLELDVTLADELQESGFHELVVTAAHGWAAGALPLHHRDPFDRLLVAQAQMERLLLVTADAALQRYDVELVSSAR